MHELGATRSASASVAAIRDVHAMQTKAGIERAVVDVLRKLGFLEGAPERRPPLRTHLNLF